MVNTQLDRAGEFFDYFEQAASLARSAGAHHLKAQQKSDDGNGIWSPDAPEPLTRDAEGIYKGWLRADILEQLDYEELAKIKLQELQAEAVASYIGERVLIRSLEGTNSIERPTRGNGTYNSAPYVIRNKVQGRIAGIDLIGDGAHARNLTVIARGLVGPRAYWVNVVRPTIASDGSAHDNLQRTVEVEFLDK